MSSPNETPKKQHRILTSLGNVTAFFAASVGVPFERITKETRLSPAALMDPDTRISEKFLLEVFRLLGKVPSKKNLALELARTVPFTFLGSPWRLLSMAPDLRTMQDLLIQNRDMISDQLEIEAIETSTEATLRMYHPLDNLDDGIGGEVCLGLSARIVRECFGDDVLTRVQFRHAARGPVSVYEDFFKVPVTFQADFNALISPREVLDRPNQKARTKIRESLEWHLTDLRQELGMGDADELADIHEAIARNAKKGDYSVFGLARTMGLSPRSLQRRMSAHDISASTRLDEARYAKALELLASERISIKEIASQLGFCDERSFRKAFQRWAQKPPAQVRREMKREE